MITTYPPTSGAAAAHASSHQNGGSDEIDVTGLSGLLADPQTPAAHKTSHQSGGGDAIKLDDLAAPDDNTDLNVSTSAHGLQKKLPGVATQYADGTGNYSVPAGSAGTSTLSIPSLIGIVAWLDADQETIYANNDPAVMHDFSGNGNDTAQATGSLKPLWKTGILNGKPGFYFDGTDDVVSFASGVFAGLTTDAEIFAVIKCDSDTPAASQSGLWTMGSLGAATNTHYRYTDGNVYDDAAATTRKTTGIPPVNLAVGHTYNIRSKNDRWERAFNGCDFYASAGGQDLYGVGGAGSTAIGFPAVASIGKSGGAYYLKGYFFELIIARWQSSYTRLRVLDYLHTKYGIQVA